METLPETASFWSMGGYGAYVWSAYGFTAAALLFMLARALRYAKRARRP